jgi:hypothetical protein
MADIMLEGVNEIHPAQDTDQRRQRGNGTSYSIKGEKFLKYEDVLKSNTSFFP